MGDNIDGVIQGILERARQRKELLVKMVGKVTEEDEKTVQDSPRKDCPPAQPTSTTGDIEILPCKETDERCSTEKMPDSVPLKNLPTLVSSESTTVFDSPSKYSSKVALTLKSVTVASPSSASTVSSSSSASTVSSSSSASFSPAIRSTGGASYNNRGVKFTTEKTNNADNHQPSSHVSSCSSGSYESKTQQQSTSKVASVAAKFSSLADALASPSSNPFGPSNLRASRGPKAVMRYASKELQSSSGSEGTPVPVPPLPRDPSTGEAPPVKKPATAFHWTPQRERCSVVEGDTNKSTKVINRPITTSATTTKTGVGASTGFATRQAKLLAAVASSTPVGRPAASFADPWEDEVDSPATILAKRREKRGFARPASEYESSNDQSESDQVKTVTSAQKLTTRVITEEEIPECSPPKKPMPGPGLEKRNPSLLHLLRKDKKQLKREDSWEDTKSSLDSFGEDEIEAAKDKDTRDGRQDNIVDGDDDSEEGEGNGDIGIDDNDFDQEDEKLEEQESNKAAYDVATMAQEGLPLDDQSSGESIMKDITNATTSSSSSCFVGSNNYDNSNDNNKIEKDFSVDPANVSSPKDASKSEAVVMRKQSKRRSGSFKKPRGYISIQEYRQLQQSRPKSQPPPMKPPRAVRIENNENVCDGSQVAPSSVQSSGVVMRNKKLYPDLATVVAGLPSTGGNGVINNSGGMYKTVQQRIEELKIMINKELNVIEQSSKALNECCHDLSLFAGSPEAIECHKLLLMACKKRETYMIEMEKLKGLGTPQSPWSSESVGPRGRLTISDIRLPVKSDFMTKFGSSQDTTAHYFLLLIRHDNHLIFTQVTSTHEGQLNKRGRDYLEFPNMINLNNISQDFTVDVEVYGMSITKASAEPGTPRRKTPKKNLLTPRSSRCYDSPGGPSYVRMTNFVHLASVRLNKSHLNLDTFPLDRVPRSCPLQSCMFMSLRCIMENNIEKKDFLTMFEDVSGHGAWHRRWFYLKSGLLSYWKYPEDETHKEPMGVIDLKMCITAHVGLVTREVCARPNTFEIETMRKQRRGDRNTLIQTCNEKSASITIKHLLSADTKEDRQAWCQCLNEALVNLRAWHPDALRPSSNHQ